MNRCVPARKTRYRLLPAAAAIGPEAHSGRGCRAIHHCRVRTPPWR